MKRTLLYKLICRYPAFIYFSYLLIIVLFGNNLMTFWDQDEAAYAGFARNMIDSGNYLIPGFTWSEIHRKTPLHFWAIALSYKVWGVNEFAVRFPAAMSVWMCILSIYLLGKKIFGKKESLLAAIIISTTYLIIGLAKVSVTDAGLLLFSTVCGFSIVHVLLFKQKIFVLIFWVSFSLALLSKGPPIILFTFVFIGILFIFHPYRKNLLILHPWFFLPLALAPLFYWGYRCYQTTEGEVFINWLIDWYILKRIGGSVLGQSGPPGTHLVGICIIFLSYLLWIPRALGESIKTGIKNFNSTHFILLGWFIAGWLIYEFSPSKLPSYVITAHVPLSIMISLSILKPDQKTNSVFKGIYIFLNCIVFISISVFPFIFELSPGSRYVYLFIGILLLISFIVIHSKGNKPGKHDHFGLNPYVFRIILFNIFLQGTLWLILFPMSDPVKNSTYRVARYIQTHAKPETSVVIANNIAHPPSLPFYLTQRFKLVTEEYNYPKLQEWYNGPQPVALILNKKTLQEFLQTDPALPYEEITSIHSSIVRGYSYFIVLNPKALSGEE